MTAAAVLPFPAAAPDPLADLRAGRARLAAEMARLARAGDGQTAAEAILATLDAEAKKLAAEEAAVWQAWAAAPEGEPPTQRKAERCDLATRRTEAEADREAARVAFGAVAPRLNEIAADILRIDHEIFSLRLANALDEARRLDAEAHEIAAKIADPLMRIMALRMALVERATAAGNRGDEAARAALLGGVTALDKLTRPEVDSDPQTVARYAAEWRNNFE